jgi:hypothetical protein
MSVNILKNKAYNEQLLEKGYVVIPFLNENEVEKLSDFFYEKVPTIPTVMYATAHSDDVVFRNQMSDFISQVVLQASSKHFDKITALGGTFMNKPPGENGVLPPHQDWNIVDENQFASYNVWIPLCDVNEKNGSIALIEKSHTWLKNYRGPNLPDSFAEISNMLWEQLQVLTIKAGHALVYDHRLLHASSINQSTENRLVVVYGIIPEKAEMRYYYLENNVLQEYACNKDFYLKGNPLNGPIGLKKLSEIAYNFENINAMQLKQFMQGKKTSANFWLKAKQWLNLKHA